MLSLKLFEKKLQREQVVFVEQYLHDIEFVKEALNNMYQLDQDVRKKYVQDRNDLELQNFMIKMDQFHVDSLQAILKIHGWITILKFGQKADCQACLLVQHADEHQNFQSDVLFLLTELSTKGETNMKNYVYLYDRVALKSQLFGMKQKYGTQVFVDEQGICSLYPYHGTIQDVSLFRQQVGLESIEEYIAKIESVYKGYAK